MNTLLNIPVGVVVLALLAVIGLAAYFGDSALKRIERGTPRKQARYWQWWCCAFGVATGLLIPISAAGLVIRPTIASPYSGLCLLPLVLLLAYGAATVRAGYEVAHVAGPYRARKQVWRYQYAFIGAMMVTGVVLAVLPISAFMALL